MVRSHIHREHHNAERTSKYEEFMHELNTTGLHFPLKFSDTAKLENIYPSISVNVLVFENNEVFPLYASKHRDRKYHINLLIISNSEGKFHYLFVRDLSALVHGRTKHDGYTHVCPSCLYCFPAGAIANGSPPELLHPPRTEVGVPITG